MFDYIRGLFVCVTKQARRPVPAPKKRRFRTALCVERLGERISPSALDAGIYVMPVTAHRLIRSIAHKSGHVTNSPVVAHKLW
jgi:hypothetical protein